MENVKLKEMIYVTKPSLPPFEEYVEEIKGIWENCQLTNQGPKHEKLQHELRNYLESDNIALFANGHIALEIGLQALEVKGEVITTPFTFASTTQAILRNGCTPVFCDIKETDYTIDPDEIEAKITERTSAIVPVHVYGHVCEIEKIKRIAEKYNLKVIYDAAHAFGVKYKGIDVSNFGDMTMFSFHATKAFNTVEGGCLAYRDESLYEKIRSLKQFGQILGTDLYPYSGGNGKMSEMHAAMGLCNLRHIADYTEKRKKVVETYRLRLDGKAGLKIAPINNDVYSNYVYFPIVIEEEETGINRERIFQALKDENVFARKYFWPLCSEFECVKKLGIQADVPVAKRISERVLTLPCYADLKIEEVNSICDIILDQCYN